MVAVNIFYSLTLFLSCLFLFAGAITEPGIIPRKNPDKEQAYPNDGASSNWDDAKSEGRKRYFINRKALQA
jgi:hypothetical protein